MNGIAFGTKLVSPNIMDLDHPASREKQFQELIERFKDKHRLDVVMVSLEEVKLICERQQEFWAAVEGRKIRSNLPDNTSGPNVYI